MERESRPPVERSESGDTSVVAARRRNLRQRFLGMYVNTYAVQSEGMQRVFDNLAFMRCKAIVIPPVVSEPVAAGQGTRIPVLHVDGYRRKLDRPVFGRRELYMRSYRVFPPKAALYANTPYRPGYQEVPASLNPHLPFEIARQARQLGMEIYVQIAPCVVPGLLAGDRPRYPDGTVPEPPQVSMYGSPAAPAVRDYGKALALDTLDRFPFVDGLFLDWAEFGAYGFRDLFAGFDGHVAREAERLGFDWPRIASGITALWERLHHLSEGDLQPAETALKEMFDENEAWSGWSELKANIIVSFYREVRQLLNEAGHGPVRLIARGWPPPWNAMSGLAYERLTDVCQAVTPKLFAFDYCALPRWYGKVLQAWNPSLSEQTILDAIVNWLDMVDDLSSRKFSDYHIPDAEEAQPMDVDHYRRRVKEVVTKISRRALVQPFAHAHMPIAMWQRMVEMLDEECEDGVWIQMYSYLSDTKLNILKGRGD